MGSQRVRHDLTVKPPPLLNNHTHTHIHNGILLSHKEGKNLLFATWTDLEGIMLSEISQTEKEKYGMISLICGILKI